MQLLNTGWGVKIDPRSFWKLWGLAKFFSSDSLQLLYGNFFPKRHGFQNNSPYITFFQHSPIKLWFRRDFMSKFGSHALTKPMGICLPSLRTYFQDATRASSYYSSVPASITSNSYHKIFVTLHIEMFRKFSLHIEITQISACLTLQR